MFKIDADSGKSIPPEIDYFTRPLTQIGVESSRIVEVPTSNSINSVPFEIRVNNTRNFLDLQRSHLLVRCSVRDLDGNRRPVGEVDYAPINLIGQTMFRQVPFLLLLLLLSPTYRH